MRGAGNVARFKEIKIHEKFQPENLKGRDIVGDGLLWNDSTEGDKT